jgi:hypothetical protein
MKTGWVGGFVVCAVHGAEEPTKKEKVKAR